MSQSNNSSAFYILQNFWFCGVPNM